MNDAFTQTALIIRVALRQEQLHRNRLTGLHIEPDPNRRYTLREVRAFVSGNKLSTALHPLCQTLSLADSSKLMPPSIASYRYRGLSVLLHLLVPCTTAGADNF